MAKAKTAIKKRGASRVRKRKTEKEERDYLYKWAIEVLDRKLRPIDPDTLRLVLKIILIDLIVLQDIGLQFVPVGRQQAEQFLDNNIRWLSSVALGFQRLFAMSRGEIGEEQALHNIHVLISVLTDLREGSPNAYTAGLARRRGDRRDNRRHRDVKDQAARVYRFLTSIGATAAESTEAINVSIQRHCELFRLPKFPILESDALRKRVSRIGDLSPRQAQDTLEMLGRPGPPFQGKLPKNNPDERALIISATTQHLLSWLLRSTAHIGVK